MSQTEILPTRTDQWEESLCATSQETIEHCRGLYDSAHLEKLLPMLSAGSTVVEAGCGLGQLVYMFASLGHHCIGLDYSVSLIEQASQRGKELTDLSGTTQWVEGNILELPLSDNSIDCYASFGVLEHFSREQQQQILAEAYRVIRPGGLLYQYVPNFWSPWTARREMRYWFRKLFPPSIVWQKNIRRSNLLKLVGEPGFEQVSCDSVYASVALRSMRLPGPLLRFVPSSVQQTTVRLTDKIGRWCDKKCIMGYGLVHIGRKVE